MLDVQGFISEITSLDEYQNQITAVKTIPPQKAKYGEVELGEILEPLLKRVGIKKLYTHQALSLKQARAGENLVIASGTASGKTLCYNLPVLEALAKDPSATALYLYPTKALAQDQQRKIRELWPDLVFGTFDGDTPPNDRRKLRDKGRLLLTNPDMLNGSILPHHDSFNSFLKNLKYVVLDEVHTYKGVFGSHVSVVLSRLKRIAEKYNSKPQFIMTSATIKNPEELARSLIKEPVLVVDNDGAPKGKKTFVLWNPPFDQSQGVRLSANTEANRLFVSLIKKRVRTIAFVRARVTAELLYRYAIDELERFGLADKVKPYRGGYLPEDRRQIEQALFSGDLLGVTSTNALELGIDIGGLDACIIVGYPGSISSVWQQAGRAGRGRDDSLVFLIANADPIDQFVIQHPDYFFAQNPESAVIDPDNPYILLNELRAMAYELPLKKDEIISLSENAPAVTELLAETNELAVRANRFFWIAKGYPASDINLRNISENTYSIVERLGDKNEAIGSIDELSAFTQLHPEAVYLHNGDTYLVRELDVEGKIAYIERADTDYFTQSVTERRVLVQDQRLSRNYQGSVFGFGDLDVTFITYMFRKIKFYTKDSFGYGSIGLPPSTLETCGLWLEISPKELSAVVKYGRDPREGLLGIGNVLASLMPLYILSDPGDVGSAVDSSNSGRPALFLFDRHRGGIGIAEKAFEIMEDMLPKALEVIEGCSCERGCPSCVGAPRTKGDLLDPDASPRGKLPDKEAALIILHSILGLKEYVPIVEEEEIPWEVKPLAESTENRLRQILGKIKEKGR
ncbi:MAG: DEAD/DEAH box helicase [Firmicutes bacterium]|nr:DEAD/DEAH box helicase [Bacillota bacterium]MDD4694626.1 DEAD/DEAH box helicase [Bacillota bacterium]